MFYLVYSQRNITAQWISFVSCIEVPSWESSYIGEQYNKYLPYCHLNVSSETDKTGSWGLGTLGLDLPGWRGGGGAECFLLTDRHAAF